MTVGLGKGRGTESHADLGEEVLRRIESVVAGTDQSTLLDAWRVFSRDIAGSSVPATADTFAVSPTAPSAPVQKRIDEILLTLDAGLVADTALTDLTEYLFADPSPVPVPWEWLASVKAIGVREDPDFDLSWADEDEIESGRSD